MIRLLNRYIPKKNVLLFCAEHLLLLGIGYLAVALRFEFNADTISRYPALFGKVFFSTLIFQVCMLYNRLYSVLAPPVGLLLARLLLSFVVAAGILSVTNYMLPDELETGRGIFLLFITLSPLILALVRLSLANLLRRKELREKVLIIGSGHLAKLVGRYLLSHHDPGFEVIGFIDQNPVRVGMPVINPKVIGIVEQIPDIVQTNNVKKVIVALPDRRGKLPLDPLLACKVRGVEVLDGISFYERLTGKILLEGLNPGWLIFSDGFSRQRLTLIVKRAIDIIGAVIGLILTAPLLLVLALLIKLDSRGPVFYRQLRTGERQRPFMLLKLRSMHEGAEVDGSPVWAATNDPRTTRVGRILRKMRLDELPQMINVLKGEMSFVGPRPERPEFVDDLAKTVPYYNLRHTVKPGITGWAQVRYRYGSSIDDAVEKMHYDLYYIKNLSSGLDLLILFETVKTMLVGQGAR